MRPPAVILAGGRGMRMGGCDKALLPLGRARVIDQIIARLGGQCGSLGVNANGDAARYGAWGLPVLADSVADFPGPLAGVLAAMDWAAAAGHADVVTVAGDTPFFPTDLVAVLIRHAAPGRPCLASVSGADQPVQPTFGLWPVALRKTLRADLLAGARKVLTWAEAQGATLAPFPDAQAFFNINTPDDLITAEALWAKGCV